MNILTTTITTFIEKLMILVNPQFDKNLEPIKIKVKKNKNRFNR